MMASSSPCTMCFCGVAIYPTLVETVVHARTEASAVVLGRVTAIDNDPQDTSFDATGLPTFKAHRPVVYHLQVQRYWKGSLSDLKEIISSVAISPCSLRLAKDSTYLIYAYTGTDGRLEGTSCSRVRYGDSAAADIQILGQGVIVNSGH